MRILLRDMKGVQHYIDDVLVAPDSWEEHMSTLRKLFERIREAGLTIKARKCEIGLHSVVFLGHEIGGGNVQPLETTVDKLLAAKVPRDKQKSGSILPGACRILQRLHTDVRKASSATSAIYQKPRKE